MTNCVSGKTFFLDQHGCAKNQVDGELIASRLLALGMTLTDDAENADVIIVNSCGFIESAKKESLDSLIGAKNAYPNAKVLLAGCLAERYAEVFKDELKEADGIFGNGNLSKIDEVVCSLLQNKRPVVKPLQQGVCCGKRNFLLSFKGSVFVKITEGCDNKCSFCAIPLIRGELRSRSAEDIFEEIKELVANGAKEINLIGQDLAAYGCGKTDSCFEEKSFWHDIVYNKTNVPIIESSSFTDKKSPLLKLMEKISTLKGDFWVRLLYIHPDHFNPDILELMKKDSRFLPYFDIPFQSGDDKIIRLMNRKGSFTSYVKLIKKIRTEFADSCIRTTFLTGFPGETEESANRTKEFLNAIQSDWSGCFCFSKEEDTPAFNMKGRVSKKVSNARAEALQTIQSSITQKKLAARCGKIYDVLIEEIIENKDGTDDGLAIGRAWFQAPDVDGNVVVRYDLDDKESVLKIVPGSVVKVKALSSSEVDIDGVYVSL